MFNKHHELATAIANTSFGTIQQKEKVRDVIMSMGAEAYVDKGTELDKTIRNFLKY